ncbi:hypothetical protein BKA83DRAFT_681227 [Pisolithus microcarpus]|nr:hypothetical protein BKA83DRAFT_681227 [Pisolithus microcarpus]
MTSKPRPDPPSGDYVIYSLIDGPLGIAPDVGLAGASGRVRIIVPSLGFYPQKFHVELVKGSDHIYEITVDGKNTQDDRQLVYASNKEAQKWAITRYRDAYKIVKLNTSLLWTDPGRDSGDRRQIRLHPPANTSLGSLSDISPGQLFKFGVPPEQKLPSGNYRIYSLVSNQPLGIQAILGYRPDAPVVEPAQPRITSRADPVVVPVPSAAPQTFTVRQVNGSEDTYVITIDRKNTRDERNLVYAFENEPAQEWVITYRENQGAYTIVKMRTGGAWTDPRGFPNNLLGDSTLPEGEQIAIPDDEPDVPEGEGVEQPSVESAIGRRIPPPRFRRQIVLERLVRLERGPPPTFPQNQLFNFVAFDLPPRPE